MIVPHITVQQRSQNNQYKQFIKYYLKIKQKFKHGHRPNLNHIITQYHLISYPHHLHQNQI